MICEQTLRSISPCFLSAYGGDDVSTSDKLQQLFFQVSRMEKSRIYINDYPIRKLFIRIYSMRSDHGLGNQVWAPFEERLKHAWRLWKKLTMKLEKNVSTPLVATLELKKILSMPAMLKNVVRVPSCYYKTFLVCSTILHTCPPFFPLPSQSFS